MYITIYTFKELQVFGSLKMDHIKFMPLASKKARKPIPLVLQLCLASQQEHNEREDAFVCLTIKIPTGWCVGNNGCAQSNPGR